MEDQGLAVCGTGLPHVERAAVRELDLGAESGAGTGRFAVTAHADNDGARAAETCPGIETPRGTVDPYSDPHHT